MRTRPVLVVRTPTATKARVKRATVLTALLTSVLLLWLVTGSQRLSKWNINVSWAENESALAKWNGLHVAEYEEIFSLDSLQDEIDGRWLLTVHVDRTADGTVESVERIVQVERLDGHSIGDNAEGQLLPYRAGTMLRDLGALLEDPRPMAELSDGMDASITFDPEMGFVRTASVTFYPLDVSGNLSLDETQTVEITVESMKILK